MKVETRYQRMRYCTFLSSQTASSRKNIFLFIDIFSVSLISIIRFLQHVLNINNYNVKNFKPQNLSSMNMKANNSPICK